MTESLASQLLHARKIGTRLPADFENTPDTEEAAY